MYNLSWADVRQTLNQLRRTYSSLSSHIPHHFCFRTYPHTTGSDRFCVVRVYFLSVCNGSSDNQICYVDLIDQSIVSSTSLANVLSDPTVNYHSDEMKSGQKLPWHQLFDVSTYSNLFTCLSQSNQLQLERKRVVGFGITDYDFHSGSGRFVFTLGTNLLVVDDNNMNSNTCAHTRVFNSNAESRLNPILCPSNPNFVAYIEDADIWLLNVDLDESTRLTYSHANNSAVSSGFPSFVIQEEFSRYVGFWWCPACDVDDSFTTYRILYEEVDESHVTIVHMRSTISSSQREEIIRYPRAGTANASSELKLVQFTVSSASGRVTDVKCLHLPTSLCSMFPWMEYIVRVGWINSRFIYCQLLDRSQTRLDVILLPVALFCDRYLLSHTHVQPSSASVTSSVPVQVLLSVQTDVWINVHDIFHVISATDNGLLSFIWLDETTGYSHLMRVDIQIILDSNIGWAVYHPRAISKTLITSGDWNVDSKQIWLCEQYGLVFFQGCRETPIERHLYVVSYTKPGTIQRLSTLGYYYNIDMHPKCLSLVSVYSSLSTPPCCSACHVHVDPDTLRVSVYGAGFITESRAIDVPDTSPLPSVRSTPSPSRVYTPSCLCQPFICCVCPPSIGEDIYCLVYPPAGYIKGTAYPTVLSIYGGPQVQLVTSSFKGYHNMRCHMLAAHGFCVVCIDTRGSHNRGVKFESNIKNRLGTVEIADQVDSLLALHAKTDSMIDMNRVAIMGWSYGGYLSLMGLALRSDIFKMAIAGAPVVSWHLYDTGYTERYMDLPCRNPCGYEAGSVLNYANQFPSEINRLLIFHGLLDENVHFVHTERFITALIRAGKPYNLQVYPTERHSLRSLESSEHFELTVINFLRNYL